MKVYIGIGATEAQILPFLVLKQTLLKHNSNHELIIENINDTSEFKSISKQLESTYGTVFSLQRFVVPKIAQRYDADVCMHLDSDMLCHGSLDELFVLAVENKTKIVLPRPNSLYKQKQQTAVFACVPSTWVIELFELNLTQFLEEKTSYVDLMRLSFSSDRILLCSHTYNSRELYEVETRILHLTDLYRQPWVNKFNSLGKIWRSEAKESLKSCPEIEVAIKEGVAKRYYLPSILSLVKSPPRSVFFKDLFFLPPQFDAYAKQRFGKEYAKKAGGLLKVAVSIWVQAVAIWHNITQHRAI